MRTYLITYTPTPLYIYIHTQLYVIIYIQTYLYTNIFSHGYMCMSVCVCLANISLFLHICLNNRDIFYLHIFY